MATSKRTEIDSYLATTSGYDTAESTIRFAPDEVLPVRIIKAVLDARAGEINERWGSNSAAGAPKGNSGSVRKRASSVD